MKPTSGIAVDGSSSGNPGTGRYRGVDIQTGKVIFSSKDFEKVTNNQMEFLAVVHGLAWLKQVGGTVPVYTDSVTAIAWVRDRRCKSKLCGANPEIDEIIERANKWLRENSHSDVMKWDTQKFGEITADYGRK